jgi:hypothetical protein
VAPTAHQTGGPATLGWNSASLEGQGTALANLRLARGPVAPSSEVPPRSGAGRPLERGSASLGGSTAPRTRFRLARGPHGLAASIPAPPTGAFNALTFTGAQVKDESTPRCAWESRPGAILPTPQVRPSPPLCDAVRHGRCQSRDTVPPTLVRLTHRALERGRRNSRRGMNVYSTLAQDYVVTSGQRDRSPPSPSVLCGHPRRPTPSRALHRHPLRCGGTGRQDTATPAVVRPTASRQPHPRVGIRTTTLRRTSTPPPSKPLLGRHRACHDTPLEDRFARTAIHSVVLCVIPPHIARTVRHA